MLRQTEWWLQFCQYNYFFWKCCFRLTTFHKELIWCVNNPNALIRSFSECWSLIWRCIFPVSILEHTQTICRQQSRNCLSVFDHIVVLALKVLRPCQTPMIELFAIRYLTRFWISLSNHIFYYHTRLLSFKISFYLVLVFMTTCFHFSNCAQL